MGQVSSMQLLSHVMKVTNTIHSELLPYICLNYFLHTNTSHLHICSLDTNHLFNCTNIDSVYDRPQDAH